VPRTLHLSLVLVFTACAPSAGPVVSAPAIAGTAPAAGAVARPISAAPGSPAACGQSWELEDAVGAGARVIVVCGSDLRREPVAVGPMTRALDPALDVARERVCACAARGAAPATVDLVVTAVPGEGRASVEPGEAEASLDPQVAQAFAGCVGSLGVTFPPFDDATCGDGARVKYVYALDVELTGGTP
jgi:hypothetical protein